MAKVVAQAVRVLKHVGVKLVLVDAENNCREGSEQHKRRAAVIAAAKAGRTADQFLQAGGNRDALRYAVADGVVKYGTVAKPARAAAAKAKGAAKRSPRKA